MPNTRGPARKPPRGPRLRAWVGVEALACAVVRDHVAWMPLFGGSATNNCCRLVRQGAGAGLGSRDRASW